MDQATGTVVEWLKQDGEPVSEGEVILIIETDKVSIEVESPGTGVLAGITAKPGDVVPIATTIAYILKPGEVPPQGTAPVQPPASAATSATPAEASRVDATPLARNVAAAVGVDLSEGAGTGPRGRVTRADVEAALSTAPPPVVFDGKVNATPAARRLAREGEIDLPGISGSGPGGRIQAADVLAYQPPAPAAAPITPEPVAASAEAEIIPLVGMRRTIAERMLASYQSIPHITFTVRVDMTRFNAVRADLNAHAEKQGASRISATALLVRLVASALTRHPHLNSSLRGEEIHVHRAVNIGVAVALKSGLIVPVVKGADRKGIATIAAEVDDLAERARQGKLLPADVTEGTFTISNLGPFGVEQFTALINPPQSGILA
ncbi:MAG: 2-oxo acid dehydrogenase subunit E2, partial [Anaerolineae bacterium]|nr:2-oxo acid dehydrogenase subunit E2 [Anaerolineae bacterium]